MVNPAAVVDIENRWRPLTEQEATNAQAFLDDAWVMLKRRISTLEVDIATDADLKDDVIRVECQMVLRVLRNPEGALLTTRQVGEVSETWRTSDSSSGGLLYLTDAELDELSPGGSTAAFTIRTAAIPFCGPTYGASCSPC